MSKDSPLHRQQMRARIAQLAARMIAQDGVNDYSLAKRKAARQAGAPDSQNLPTNVEIEEALRTYQELYQADEHEERLRQLREIALRVMLLMQQFSPHLTGAVLSGNAGRYADIHLHLYTDNAKDLEIYLRNRDIQFRTRQYKLWVGETSMMVPDLIIVTEQAEVHMTVLSTVCLRQPIRLSPDGRPLQRASITSVQALLDQRED
ncbi:MAG TPA: hypothetical protein VFA81_01610 [Burkholderiales bacterium]|nr:hypothetical protein [Burkholderiales bacterium]